ncbi:MAG: LemA family protein [Candidatus Eisenbacteria bacterium]
MKAGGWIAIVVIAVVIIGVVGWYINGLNRVVRMHEGVGSSWAQVETMLQRRNDLIPNLVNTVKGYASHEEELYSEITRLRSQWAGAATVGEKIENARAMESALGRLMVVVENYPQLRATENFQTLQAQLEGSENRIAVERSRYNEAVRAFNTYIREVFGKFFAKRRGLTEPKPYFEAAPEAQEVPEVKFD